MSLGRAFGALREGLGRALFALLGARRFHRLIGLAQTAKAGRRGSADLSAIDDAVARFHVLSYEAGALNDTYRPTPPQSR